MYTVIVHNTSGNSEKKNRYVNVKDTVNVLMFMMNGRVFKNKYIYAARFQSNTLRLFMLQFIAELKIVCVLFI